MINFEIHVMFLYNDVQMYSFSFSFLLAEMGFRNFALNMK